MKKVILFLTCFLFVVCTTARAQKNWDGDEYVGNFNWWNNWNPNSDPNAGWGFGVDLNFNFQNSAIATGLYYNLGGWRDIGNIVWKDTYNKSMTLSGEGGGINFKQKLENYSSFAQTITVDLSGGKDGAPYIELNPVNGNLTLSGNFYNDFSHDYRVYGRNNRTLTLNTTLGVGLISPANVDFSVEEASNVQVNNIQTWAGTTTVKAGSFKTGSTVTLASSGIVVSGGTFETTSANVVGDTGTVNVSSGEYKLGGNDTVGSLAASGGVVTVASGATLTANGNSSITGSARATGGTVAIANNSRLTLANSSTTTSSDLSIGSGATLAGTGGTSGQIKGSGLLSPGNSPGILTSGSVDLTGGIDFAFEFTAAGAPTYSLAGNSKNDLLHLTSGTTPFSGSFSRENTVSFYFNDAGLSASLASLTPTTYLGGFFVDSSSFDIAGLLSNATKQYFIAAAGGSTTLNGVSYNLMSNEVASRIILSNVNQSGADFTTGTANGTVLGVMAVPEPSAFSLLAVGLGGLAVMRRRRS
jgi:hypothetical protein